MTNAIDITDTITIHEIKEQYNTFMEQSKDVSEEIKDAVNVEGIEDIEKLIVDFDERLEGATVAQEQSTVDKTAGKTIETLSLIPFFGKFIEKDAEKAKAKEAASRTTRQILQEMFDAFTEKSTILEENYSSAYELKKILLEKEQKLIVFSESVKKIVLNAEDPLDRIAAVKFGAIVEANFLKTKDKIYNKLNFILQFIEEQLTTISAMMPGIESGLVEDAEIGRFLTSVADMNKAFKSLTKLSNSVGRRSSETVMTLITEVNSSMGDTVDIEHMEKLAETNQKFTKSIIEGTELKLKRDAQTYSKLMAVGESLDQNVLAYKESNEKVLLETKQYMGKVESTIESTLQESNVEIDTVNTVNTVENVNDADSPIFEMHDVNRLKDIEDNNRYKY